MKYFTIKEMCASSTATQYGISNNPDQTAINNLTALVENVLDPLREAMGCPIKISSGYRCKALNTKVGGSKTSQHMTGQAADIQCTKKVNGKTVIDYQKNRKLYDTILALGLPFDQIILEKGTMTEPVWIHVSFKRTGTNRRQKLYYNGKYYVNV